MDLQTEKRYADDADADMIRGSWTIMRAGSVHGRGMATARAGLIGLGSIQTKRTWSVTGFNGSFGSIGSVRSFGNIGSTGYGKLCGSIGHQLKCHSRGYTNMPAPKEGTTAKDIQRMTMRSILFFILSGALLLIYFEYERARTEGERKEKKNDTAGKPRVGGPFVLVDHTGRIVTDMDYRGKYLLLYFGYTFCPDVCPEELEKMAIIVDTLSNTQGYTEETILPIFISCDPKRDSIESIREYLLDYHPKFIGLTGTYNQIKRIAKAYRLYFSAPPKAVDDDETDYLVDHSIFFYLVGPDGKYIAHYGKDDTAESVTAKIVDVIKKRRGA